MRLSLVYFRIFVTAIILLFAVSNTFDGGWMWWFVFGVFFFRSAVAVRKYQKWKK